MKNRAARVLLLASMIAALVPSVAFASDGPIQDTVTYTAESPDKSYEFKKKIEQDGHTYKLTDVRIKVLSECFKTIESEVKLSEKSDFVIAGSEHDFAETIERDGIIYTLSDVKEVKADPYKQEVTAYSEFDYAVTKSSVPQTKRVVVKNEKTEEDETVECSLSDVNKTGSKWMNSYIDIQFKDYGSTAFYWQGILIANDMYSFPLVGYEKEILQSVGLTEQTGKVLKHYWTSDAYEKDGLLYRDAKVDIQKLMPVYRATYHGEIESEMVFYEATYTGTSLVETDEKEYTLEATATYEKSKIVPYILGVFLVIIFFVLLLFIIAKRKRENQENIESDQHNKFQKKLISTNKK